MDYTRTEAKAWANKTFHGFYEAPFTPLTAQGAINEKQLAENIEKYLALGVDGLVVGGFIADVWAMTYGEWQRYHELCAQVVRGRVPLFTIILESSVRQAIEKLNFCEKLGYDGAEIMNPSVQLRAESEIYDFFKHINDHTKLALVLYRTYQSGTLMSMDLVQRLADLDLMVGVKQGSLSRSDTLLMRRRIRKDFIISEPIEGFFLDDLRVGGQVLWAAFWYLAYGKKRHLAREYYNLARAGKHEQAREPWEALQPIRTFFEDIAADIARTGTYATHMAMMRPWMDAIGFPIGPPMAPVREYPKDRREVLLSRLSELGVV